jgi:hypothetical protein
MRVFGGIKGRGYVFERDRKKSSLDLRTMEISSE